MNQQELTAILENITKTCIDTLSAKGKEYSSATDRLSNFKSNARHGRKPLDVWDIYASKHADSIETVVGKLLEIQKAIKLTYTDKALAITKLLDGQSEPILMRFVDQINYSILGYALIKETYDEAANFLDTEKKVRALPAFAADPSLIGDEPAPDKVYDTGSSLNSTS
jgi:hypothetical protein